MRARHALWLIPLLALVVPAAASAADPEDVLLGWSWGQVSLVSDASGEIECTVSDALLHLAEPGEPDLPAHLVRVPIPDGTKVASWELAGASTSERPAQGILATALQDAPTPDGGPRQVALRDDAYASGSYPASRVRYLSTSMRRGQVFAHFAVYPVVAIEEGAQLSLLESGRLIVHLEGDATAPRPLKVLRSGAEDLWRRDFQGEGRSQALREAVSDLPALSSAPVEYLIITTEALAPSVQLLADWKNQSGTPTVIRTVEWIRENYPNGVDDQERIRHFLQAAYQYWGVQYVLIAGGPAQVPMRLAKSYSWNVPAGVDIITDLYYACLDGNWNADGDAVFGEPVRGSNPPNPIGDDVDFDAELYVGRIPASDATQLLQFLQKYVNTYIKSPNTQGYLDRVLFLGEVLFDAEWKRSLLPRCGACGSGCDTCVSLDGAGDAVRTIGIIDQAIDEGRVPPLEKVELYEWYEYWRQNGRPNAQPETKSSVIDKINEGMGLIHHVGHGDRDRMSIGTIDGFDGAGRLLTSDARAVTNGDKIGVLYSINCNSAAIDYDCVAEALLFAENGGVICYIGSTNLDFPAAATGFMESTYTKIFHDKAPYLGDAYYHTIAEQMAGNTGFDSYRRFLSYSLILLGDPQIHMWLGTPKPLEVSAQQTSYTLGESSLTINVRRNGQGVPDVQVCAYKPNDTYAIATTNANGQAVVPFQATSTGNFIVTATGFTSIPGTFSRNVEKLCLLYTSDA
ncbi:MAG: C25 family cysteine peptidase, partial [Candidatus Eisenbacteria bacterium]|nr:C25 family cysteine peptidase [Candidatus Eisenbacteria bacterium]